MRFENVRGVLSDPTKGPQAMLVDVNGDVLPGKLNFSARLKGNPGFYFSTSSRYTLDFTIYETPSGMVRANDVEVVSITGDRVVLRATSEAKVPIISASPRGAPHPPPSQGVR